MTDPEVGSVANSRTDEGLQKSALRGPRLNTNVPVGRVEFHEPGHNVTTRRPS